jgi:hypothetical protein
MNRTKSIIQSLVTWIPEGGPALTAKGGNVSLAPAHVSALKFLNQVCTVHSFQDASTRQTVAVYLYEYMHVCIHTCIHAYIHAHIHLQGSSSLFFVFSREINA